jgi:hypothetical protein
MLVNLENDEDLDLALPSYMMLNEPIISRVDCIPIYFARSIK